MKATEIKSINDIYRNNLPFSVNNEIKVKDVPVTTPREVIVQSVSEPIKAKKPSTKRKPRKTQKEK